MPTTNLTATSTAVSFTVSGKPQLVSVVVLKKGAPNWQPVVELVNPPEGAKTVAVSASPGDQFAVGTASPADWQTRTVVAPVEKPPVEKPPVEKPQGSPGYQVVVDTGGWGGNLHDELTAAGIKNRRINNPNLIGEIEAKGGHVSTVCLHNAGWGSSQGPLLYNPASFGAEIGGLAKAHPNVDAWEVLNEPEGAQNCTAADKIKRYVELLKASREAFTANSVKAKLIASWAPTYSFGKAWAAVGGLQYVDGVVVHPYGGSSGQHGGLKGGRELVEQAHRESGKPVYITEIGWPTAQGQPSTGDSQQWSEAQQAQAITDFDAWCRTQPYVAMFVYFNAVDYGTNNWYGIERSNRSHKPGFKALADAAAKG